MQWVMLLVGVLANSSASLLIKIAMMPPRTFPSLKDPMGALMNWPFWLGLVFYGIALLLYAASLVRLPLHIAHPILTGGAIGLVALISIRLFGESVYWYNLLGILLIIIGIILVTMRNV
jgi:small multidrug resistance pump